MFFGKVYYHLLSTGETNIPWIAFYPLFDSESGLILCIGHRNTLNLWEVVDHFKRTMHATHLIIIHETWPGIKLATFGLVDEFSTKEGNFLLIRAEPLS